MTKSIIKEDAYLDTDASGMGLGAALVKPESVQAAQEIQHQTADSEIHCIHQQELNKHRKKI